MAPSPRRRLLKTSDVIYRPLRALTNGCVAHVYEFPDDSKLGGLLRGRKARPPRPENISGPMVSPEDVLQEASRLLAKFYQKSEESVPVTL